MFKSFLFLACIVFVSAAPIRILIAQTEQPSPTVGTSGDTGEAIRDYQNALTIWGDGKSSEAEALLLRAQAIRERVGDPKDPELAKIIERLGALDYNRKNYTAAEVKFRRALDIDLAAFGERNGYTSVALGDVGAALREQGRFNEAEPYVLRSLAIRRSILPENHPAIARSLNNLTRIYLGERRYSLAHETAAEQLKIDQIALPQGAETIVQDKALLEAVLHAEATHGKFDRTLFLASGIAAASLALLVFLTVRQEISAPKTPPSAVVATLKVLSTIGLYGGAGFATLFATDGLVAAHAPSLFNDTSNSRGIGKIGFLLGVLFASLLFQAGANLARAQVGLPIRAIRLFRQDRRSQPEVGEEPRPALLEAGDGKPPWFAAMEYYALFLNRTYKVFVTERMLSGAKVRGITVSPPISAPLEMFDQTFWVNTRSARAYAGIDVQSSDFLVVKRSNFQIKWSEIVEVSYLPGEKWGMGYVPHSGRIALRLKSGKSRELILLGLQDGPALKEELENHLRHWQIA